jgi:hypothetical protein
LCLSSSHGTLAFLCSLFPASDIPLFYNHNKFILTVTALG